MPSNITISVDVYHLLIWMLVGLVAGFLASRLMLGRGIGVVGDITVGILGAVIGNLLAEVFNLHFVIQGHATLTQIVIAFIGALVPLLFLRLLGMGRRHRRAAL